VWEEWEESEVLVEEEEWVVSAQTVLALEVLSWGSVGGPLQAVPVQNLWVGPPQLVPPRDSRSSIGHRRSRVEEEVGERSLSLWLWAL